MARLPRGRFFPCPGTPAIWAGATGSGPLLGLSADGGSTVHRPQPLPPSTMHQGGLAAAAADTGSAYGARHSFSSYSDSFMNPAASSNHMNPVSNGLSPQVGGLTSLVPGKPRAPGHLERERERERVLKWEAGTPPPPLLVRTPDPLPGLYLRAAGPGDSAGRYGEWVSPLLATRNKKLLPSRRARGPTAPPRACESGPPPTSWLFGSRKSGIFRQRVGRSLVPFPVGC